MREAHLSSALAKLIDSKVLLARIIALSPALEVIDHGEVVALALLSVDGEAVRDESEGVGPVAEGGGGGLVVKGKKAPLQ